MGRATNWESGIDLYTLLLSNVGFPGGIVLKNLPAYAGDARHTVLILGWGRSPRVGNGNPL